LRLILQPQHFLLKRKGMNKPLSIVIILIAIFLSGCKDKNHKLIGSWKNEKQNLKIQFEKEGKGVWEQNGTKANFTYSSDFTAYPIQLNFEQFDAGTNLNKKILAIANFEHAGSMKLALNNGEANSNRPTEFGGDKELLLDKTGFKITDLLQPQFYIQHGGLWLLLFIVFAETGLFAGFLFPGDSLLFVAGIYWRDLSASFLNMPFILLMLMVVLFAVLGNMFGYWFGKRIGPAMYNWKDTWYFKQRHLQSAAEFYGKKGGMAIFLARFIPFVRTFGPIVAGIVKMDWKKFMYYTVTGAFAWVFSMMLLGRYLQEFLYKKYRYDLTDHIELIVLGIVFVTTAPVLYKLFFSKKKAATNNE
jgi:membrane-associated protein